MVIAAVVLVGTEILALGVMGQKAWGNVYFTSPKADALQIQAQADSSPSISAIPVRTANLAPSIPTKLTKATRTILVSIRPTKWKLATTLCPANWSYPSTVKFSF